MQKIFVTKPVLQRELAAGVPPADAEPDHGGGRHGAGAGGGGGGGHALLRPPLTRPGHIELQFVMQHQHSDILPSPCAVAAPAGPDPLPPRAGGRHRVPLPSADTGHGDIMDTQV